MNSFLFLIVVFICIVDKHSIVSTFCHGSLEKFFLYVVNKSCFCMAKFGSLIKLAIYFKCCTSQNSDMGIVLAILRMSSLEYLKDQSRSPITCVAGSTPFFLCFGAFFRLYPFVAILWRNTYQIVSNLSFS